LPETTPQWWKTSPVRAINMLPVAAPLIARILSTSLDLATDVTTCVGIYLAHLVNTIFDFVAAASYNSSVEEPSKHMEKHKPSSFGVFMEWKSRLRHRARFILFIRVHVFSQLETPW
jgi:hypothetical protein